MFGYVYRTRNLVNGSCYVGQHHGDFTSKYLGSGIILVKAVRKYGKGMFKVELLEYADTQKQLDDLEISFILSHRKCGIAMYNIKDGGCGSPAYTIEKKIAHSERMKKLLMSPDMRRKWSLAKIGHKHSEETKMKIRQGQLNRPDISEKTRELHRKRMLDPLTQAYFISRRWPNSKSIQKYDTTNSTTSI